MTERPSALPRSNGPVDEWTTSAAIALLLALQYGLYGLFRHWRFGSSAYDLGIFDQAIWHLSRLEAPASTISGFQNILGDHFSPILVALAPAYWIWRGPESLIVAQALLLGASAIPVYLLAREALGRGAAGVFAFAYGQYWGLQRAAAFDFHELAFAPLLIASAMLFYRRRRFGALVVTLVLLCLVKEDMFAVCFGIGVLMALDGRVWMGAAIASSAVVGFLVVVSVVIPNFNSAHAYAYAGAFPDLASPLSTMRSAFTPPTKIYTALLWLAPFAFLPVASRQIVVFAALAATRLLSTSANHWGPAFHYSAPMAPVVASAAIDTLRRLRLELRPRWHTSAIVTAVLLSSLFLPGNQPLWDLFKARHYRSTASTRAAREALASIPADASVVAQDAIVPHLSRRPEIYLLREGAPSTDFVALLRGYSFWPNASREELERLERRYRDEGYRVVYDNEGWLVLSHPSPVR